MNLGTKTQSELTKIASSRSLDLRTRVDALRRISHQKYLELIVSTVNDVTVRMLSLQMITDEYFLADIIDSDLHDDIKAIATRKLYSASLRIQI